ncbi:MAG: carboxypeptidase regulatory-like domain-containing protein [Candidatus Solibacter usitatus]|nr:carboxypeptidase regulatory-like domain-containing protein [Candidatus Solibacter usitatus]
MAAVLRYLCCAALFGAAFAQSDKETALMLPKAVRISGVVTDSDGKPLSQVWIDHTGAGVETVRTDTQGRFDIETRAPAVVFRAYRGYQSKYWRVSENRNLTVTLTGPVPRMNECRASWGFVSLNGSMSRFCFPKVRGVRFTKPRNDTDYGKRVFWVVTSGGEVAMQHASGAMWGDGTPFDRDVWSARDYVEQTYSDPEGVNIRDARGKSADGKCWRVLGHAFESASYRDVSEQDAALLDRVLDGARVKPWPIQK